MNRNVRLALGLVVITSIWMITGVFADDSQEKTVLDTNAKADEQTFTVQVIASRARDYATPIYIRAKTEAEREVLVSAELDGLIVSTPIEEGQRVKEGEVLCVLRSDDQKAAVDQMQAQLDKARLDFEAANRLRDGGFQSKSQIAAAKASLAMALSDLERAQLRLQNLNIRAPFTGRVEARLKDAGDFIMRGQPCVKLIQLNPIVVSGQVNANQVLSLRKGDLAGVHFEHGVSQEGHIRYVAKSAGALTRTYRVELALDNSAFDIVAGLSTDVLVKGKPVKAHKVPSSILSLRDSGELGLRAVSEGRVEFHRVNLLGDDEEGVWVTGLPEALDIIVVGQEYVFEGQEVSIEYVRETSTAQESE